MPREIVNEIKSISVALRKLGFSHRQIASRLKISVGSAANFTRNIKLTWTQHVALKKQTGIFRYSSQDRAAWSRMGSKNWFSRLKYDESNLIGKIKEFVQIKGRIPTKREFNKYWQSYRRIFGTWNNAIKRSGFIPNPERFAKKFIANDGHKCDSLSEKIIGDWLFARKIPHKRDVYYPGQKKFKSDFLINRDLWVEFLGLRGQLESYDKLYKRKTKMANENNIRILELMPNDLTRLETVFANLEIRQNC